MAPTLADVSTVTLPGDGIELRCLDAGGDGPLALCLHGFPDSATTWRHLLPRLRDAGYRAVAPYQRGYAPSPVADDGRYQTAVLARDANAIHEAVGAGADAVLIGHDWGAPAAYGAALDAPQRWARVVGMAVPPGAAIGAAFLTNLQQLQRSWYMFLFQHPLADVVVPANDLAFIDLLWEQWSPGFAAADDVEAAKTCLRDPAALAAALGYYRAALGASATDPALADLQAAMGATVPDVPLLYLHGAADGCIGTEVAESARAMVPSSTTVEVVDGCGHFLHLERPDVVNARILEHLA